MIKKIYLFCILVLIAFCQNVYANMPGPHNVEGIRIEGAHIVSEGGYFRFQIWNNNDYIVSVRLSTWNASAWVFVGDTYPIGASQTIKFDMIAPNITASRKVINYRFTFNSTVKQTDYVDFPVTVVSSDFIYQTDSLQSRMDSYNIVLAILIGLVLVVSFLYLLARAH